MKKEGGVAHIQTFAGRSEQEYRISLCSSPHISCPEGDELNLSARSAQGPSPAVVGMGFLYRGGNAGSLSSRSLQIF